jgi:transcriptional regulator with XRE-family HTH domain
VGRRLSSLRNLLDLTQEIVAERAGTTAKNISRIENGHENPTIGVLRAIIELGLRVPLSTFFAELGDQREDTVQVQSLFNGATPATRRRMLKVLKALADD